MTYKTILTVLRNDAEARRVMPVAIALARKYDSHLVAVHAEPSPVSYSTPEGFPDTDFIERSLRDCEQRAAEMKTYVETECAAEGINVEWMSTVTFAGDSAVAALPIAFNSDLIIAGQTDPSDNRVGYANVEALLFESGRPVLFVPFAGKLDIGTEHAVVAWNGTRESARAVFDALPLLKDAGKVEVLLIDAQSTEDQDAATAGADIAEALMRHGITVDVRNLHSDGLTIAAIIENYMADSGAGLLVMGGYSHSRLREMIFGGTTRTILSSMPSLTLMSH